jgi:predicted DCC family thiol-disulfide oxidoreductase YuxK
MNKVIYDGECPTCIMLREFAEDKMERSEFIFINYQSESFEQAAPNIARHEAEQALFVLTENGKQVKGAKAVFEIMSELPGGWGLVGRTLKKTPFHWVAEPFYQLFAKHRHRISNHLLNTVIGIQDQNEASD